MIKYLFSARMSRFDVLLAWVVSGMFYSGAVGGWSALGLMVVGTVASAVGEAYINQQEQ